MQFVLITHEVDDYRKWKKGFDAAAGRRKDAGELEFQVLAHESRPNCVVHFSKWTSLAAARDSFESDEVAKIRSDLGVREPDFVYLNELDAGVL